MPNLKALENQSIYALREAVAKAARPAILWRMDAETTALVWLARKAFFGQLPFPVVARQNADELPEIAEFRASCATRWGLDLVLVSDDAALSDYDGLIVAPPMQGHPQGSRRRLFRPQGGDDTYAERPIGFWDQFDTGFPWGAPFEAEPMVRWREVDLWHYVQREGVPVCELYLAHNGARYTALDPNDPAQPIASSAATIDQVVAEIEQSLPAGVKKFIRRGAESAWFESDAVAVALNASEPEAAPSELPLRLPIQDAYQINGVTILAGRVECGRVRVGDNLLFSPANVSATVASIELFGVSEEIDSAEAGQCIGLTLSETVEVGRAQVASHEVDLPVETDVFRARIYWFGPKPLMAGEAFELRLNTTEEPVTVQTIERVIAIADGASDDSAETVAPGQVAELVLRSDGMLALDSYTASPRTGHFMLMDGYEIAGSGTISMDGYADQRELITVRSTNVVRVEQRVTAADRAARHGHLGGVLWLTGLSGSGKSTLAIEVENRLFNQGYQVYVLDGDNVRHGLNANLSFSPEDRAENIRRVGEVAALFAGAGFIVITAFISPYRSDRDRARRAVPEAFHEVFIDAGLEVCESRDPKGLYKMARAGEIPDFTGISAPYEPPSQPELLVPSAHQTVEESVQTILDYVESNFTKRNGAVKLSQVG